MHLADSAEPPTMVSPRRIGRTAATVAATMLVAGAAWLSQGRMALDGPGASRLAILPVSPGAMAIVLAALASVVGLRRAGASMTPLVLLALPLVAWLPIPLPAAWFLWSGPMTIGVWVAMTWAMIASVPPRPWTLPLHPSVRAGVMALAVFGVTAWRVAPSLPAGDEPHYLVITQSVLLDHDLRIENNHRRGDYLRYFTGDLSKPDSYRRGRDGALYSVHAPGLPILVAPAFLLGGYRGVVLFLLLISSCAAALTWELARRVTGRTDAAWFAWAALVLAPPMLLNAFTVLPDAPGALLVLTGVWALVRAREERTNDADAAWPWFLHGAGLAMLPWLHTRFAPLAGCLGALVMLDLARTRNPAGKACSFLVVPTVSALAWIAFFIALYGAPDPAIPYRGSDLGSPALIPGGIGGIFFDQTYGLFITAPVMTAIVAGIPALGRRPGPFRWLSAQLLFLAVPYVLTVTHFGAWWAGSGAPARFLVPLLPSLSIAVAAAWAAADRRGTRAMLCLGLLTTGLVAAAFVFVDGGRLGYVNRDGLYAPWLEWINRAVDLGHAVPSFFARAQRGAPGGLFFREILVWTIAAGASWIAVRAMGERPWFQRPARLETTAAAAVAAAAMAGCSLVWRIEGVTGRDAGSASMDVLRQAGALERSVTIDLAAWRRITADNLAQRLWVRLTPRPRTTGAPRDDRGLFSLPEMPAGVYRLRAEPANTPGWLMIGIGRDQFAIVTRQLDGAPGDILLRLPVSVRGLVVRADEDARSHLRELVVQPVRVARDAGGVSPLVARRAVRYGSATAFFMDERSFPEPGGFWVAGASGAAVVVQTDTPGPSLTFQVRGAPIDNQVTLRSGRWRQSLSLAAREQRRIEVPLGQSSSATLVTLDVDKGVRPAAVDPSSRDGRFLGAWFRID